MVGRFNGKVSCLLNYRKIPKITPSKYKPPKPVTQKTSLFNGRGSWYKSWVVGVGVGVGKSRGCG